MPIPVDTYIARHQRKQKGKAAEEEDSLKDEESPYPDQATLADLTPEQEEALLKSAAAKALADIPETEKLLLCTTTPEPFVEPVEKPYIPEEGDRYVPLGGYLQDLVAATRGQESPTLFWLWSGLWTISTLLHREAAFKWLPDEPLWPNLYMIIVAPPGICRKGPPIRKAVKVLKVASELLPTRELRFRKKAKFTTSKATPEYLSDKMKPEKEAFLQRQGDHARIVTVNKGSQLAIAATELVTFLGKQQYNTGLIEKLTKFYDADEDDVEGTIGRGETELKDVYATMLGAATPDGLRMSIPPEAFGGGFISRTTLVYQDHRTRSFSRPKVFAGYPTTRLLAERLAWIAYNARSDQPEEGLYDFTPAAAAWYECWYNNFWKKAEDTLRAEEHRMDILLIKVAVLIRAQEYRLGFDVDVQHLEASEKLLKFTYNMSRRTVENVSASPWLEALNFIRKYIKNRGSVSRKSLLQRLSSKGYTADQLNSILDLLSQENTIEILIDDIHQDRPSSRSSEIYRYCGAMEEDSE